MLLPRHRQRTTVRWTTSTGLRAAASGLFGGAALLSLLALPAAPGDAAGKRSRPTSNTALMPGRAAPPSAAGSPARYTRPPYLGKRFPQQRYKRFVLIGNPRPGPGAASNRVFYARLKKALDLIERETPLFFSMLGSINRDGRRVFFYTGKIGPASFNAWGKDYIVRITATHFDERPAFDNNPYYLATSLVHEMVGHGRQAADRRLWNMYDWCGNDPDSVRGVVVQVNRFGGSSGLVEYEANLYAKWFLEHVQNEYPDYIERVIKRYLRIVKFLSRRFLLWYDDDKPTWVLLQEFETHFRALCPGLRFTPHPKPPRD